MVLDDDEDVRGLAVRVFDWIGYRIIKATRAAIVEEILAGSERVDLLLSDVMLSGKRNGPEFTGQAPKIHPELKVFFM